MEKTINFDISPKQIKYKNILDKEFVELEIWAISDANPNRNGSYFTLDSLIAVMPTVQNTPIVGFFEHGDFTTHEGTFENDPEYDKVFWNTEKGERILGWVRESDPVEIVEEDGLHWLKFRCILCVNYCYKQVKRLLKDKRKKVSVEIKVDEDGSEEINGIEVIHKFALKGVAILGSKNGKAVMEGIKGAHLSVLEGVDDDTLQEQRKMLAFAYKQFECDNNGSRGENLAQCSSIEDNTNKENEKEVKQEDMSVAENYGYNIKIDKSKEAISDTPWGSINKTELRNKVVEADNFKTIADDIFLDLREGWEDGETTKLKYPVMQIKDDNVAVYNREALASAKAYATQHDETAVLEKLHKIYKDLDLDEEQECKYALCCDQYDCDCGEEDGDDGEKPEEGENKEFAEEKRPEVVAIEEISPDIEVIKINETAINEEGGELAMQEVDLGIPQCSDGPSAAEVDDGVTVLVDAEAPAELMPEEGLNVVVANDEGKVEVKVVDDENAEIKDKELIEKYNSVCQEMEALKLKCHELECKCSEQEEQIAKYCGELSGYCDYNEIKESLAQANKTLEKYRCNELKDCAESLMDGEYINKEYCDEIMRKCECGEYTCSDDIKKDVAMAIYNSRPTQHKRFELTLTTEKEVEKVELTREQRIAARNKKNK